MVVNPEVFLCQLFVNSGDPRPVELPYFES